MASVGLNPSNREFVDDVGIQLEGTLRRFHTLRSLGIATWGEADARHLRLILESCRSYFLGNPYDRWFRRLDQVVAGARASYYWPSRTACHLDLIPYATERKWAELTPQQRSALLAVSADTLGLLLRESPVRILILNGQSVVEQFQEIIGRRLEQRRMPAWSLSRLGKPPVAGVAYSGTVDSVSGISLTREILVLGFDHNLQSSFGVTTEVICAIRDWVSAAVRDAAAA